MQVWPVLRYLEATAPSTAASMPASSKTMKGALPPSSSEIFFTVEADCCISSLPISVEPVKVTFRTSGFDVISPPMAPALPVTMLRTPSGTPARRASSASAKAESGVMVAGLTTIVQPAASAGAALRVIMAAGKFHGVMAAQTPMGCFSTTMRRSLVGAGTMLPYTRFASSA